MLGGWIVDLLSWRWVFLVIIPFAIVALAVAVFKIPTDQSSTSQSRLDIQGALLTTSVIGLLTFGLIGLSERGWSDPIILSSLIAAFLLFYVFIRVEQRVQEPMIPFFALPFFNV